MRAFAIIGVMAALALLALALRHSGPDTRAAATGAAQPPAAAVLQGDVDCSGIVDSIDALQVLRSVASLPVSADCLAAAGDVDCSTQADSIDGLLILRFVASLSVNTPAGCTAIGQPLEGGGTPTPGPDAPTSFNLIDQAVANGEIDEETALTYKVFALFEDNRLPDQYKGQSREDLDADVLSELSSGFNSLSSSAKATLQPFLLPPTAPGSWYDLRYSAGASVAAEGPSPTPSTIECPSTKYTGVPTENGKAIVWWQERFPEDQAKAEEIAAAIDSEIWSAETGLMGREPLSDEEFTKGVNDGRFDIFLIDMEDRGETIGFILPATRFSECPKTPVFIYINRLNPKLKVTAAHELFHAIQAAVQPFLDSCSSLHWLGESTATWAQDYVYPDDNREHERTTYFDNPSASLGDTIDDQEYGAYIFFLYLARKYNPNLIAEAWARVEQDLFRNVLNGVIPGGFSERWPEFVLYNWNRPPVDFYEQWDGVTAGAASRGLNAPQIGQPEAKEFVNIELQGGSEAKYEPQYPQLRDLTAQYYHFKVTDPAVKLVEVANPYDSPSQWVNVQALILLAGEDWKVEDWTGSTGHSYCLDQTDSHLEEIVIIVSNSHWDTGSPYLSPEFTHPLAIASDSCGWTGSTTYTRSWSGTSAAATAPVTTRTLTVTGENLKFEPSANVAAAQQTYQLVSGTLTWQYSVTYRPSPGVTCVAGANETAQLSPGAATLTVQPGANGGSYSGAGSTNTTGMAHGKCNESGQPFSEDFGFSDWFATGPQPRSFTGDTIAGQYEMSNSQYGWTFQR